MSWSFAAAGTLDEAKQQLSAVQADGTAAALRDAALRALEETTLTYFADGHDVRVVVESAGHVGPSAWPSATLTIKTLGVRVLVAAVPEAAEEG